MRRTISKNKQGTVTYVVAWAVDIGSTRGKDRAKGKGAVREFGHDVIGVEWW